MYPRMIVRLLDGELGGAGLLDISKFRHKAKLPSDELRYRVVVSRILSILGVSRSGYTENLQLGKKEKRLFKMKFRFYMISHIKTMV
jgi:hypothetical protein